MYYSIESRLAAGKPALVPTGRSRDVPREILEEIVTEQAGRNAGGSCITIAGLRAAIASKMKKRRDDNPNLPPVTPKELESKTLRSYIKEYFPESSNAPVTQAVRREEARYDPYNPVAFAATLKALVGEGQGKTIPYHLLFNSDQTSMLIGADPVTKVFMVAGTKEKLKANNLNAGVTATRAAASQMRSLQVMCTTSAIGKLVIVIVSIKDKDVDQMYIREALYINLYVSILS